jgi:Uma2 family endonuclease
MTILQKEENEKYTYIDYLGWSKESRCEIIEGIPYMMSPAPSRLHQEISGELFFQIRSYLNGKDCKIYAAPFDVRLYKDASYEDNNIVNVVQPDITVICDKNKLDERGAKGTPDFIIEIVSKSSTFLDYVKKLNLYGDYGVREYWIVNPLKRNVLVYKISEDGNYGTPDIYMEKDKIQVSIFESLIIDLSSIW